MEEKQQCGSIKKEALLKDRRERAHSKAHTDKKEDQGTSKDVYRIPPRAKIHSAHGQCSQQRDTDPQASNEKVMQKEDRTELCEEHSAFEETAASLQYPGAVRIRGFCPESAWDEMSYERSDEDGSASQTIGAAENPITVVAEVVKEDLEISQIRERMQVNETKNANKEDSGQFRGCRFLSISIGLLVVGAIVGVVLGVTLGREGNEDTPSRAPVVAAANTEVPAAFPTMAPTTRMPSLTPSSAPTEKCIEAVVDSSIKTAASWRFWTLPCATSQGLSWFVNRIRLFSDQLCTPENEIDTSLGTPIQSGSTRSDTDASRAFMSNFRWEGTPDDNGTLWIGIEFPVNRTIRCAHWVESISHRASDFLVQARLQGREDWTAVWFEEGFDGSQGISVQW